MTMSNDEFYDERDKLDSMLQWGDVSEEEYLELLESLHKEIES